MGGGEKSPLKLTVSPPQTAAKLCAQFCFFFDRDNELQTYVTETLTDRINTGNYSSLSNQNGANLCLKCTRIRLAARLRMDPLGELMCYPRPPGRNRGRTSKGRKGRGGRGTKRGKEREPTYKRREGK